MGDMFKIGHILKNKFSGFYVAITNVDDEDEILECVYSDGSWSTITFKKAVDDFDFTGLETNYVEKLLSSLAELEM